jgi:putative membrane protein
MQDWFGFARNHYDRIGHFAQGFIPALITREVLIRKSPLKSGKWLSFIVISICLSISALYELFEFSYAVSIHASAEEFLGTQGDEWDAQKDMLFALIGAITAVFTLSLVHNKFLQKLGIKTD